MAIKKRDSCFFAFPLLSLQSTHISAFIRWLFLKSFVNLWFIHLNSFFHSFIHSKEWFMCSSTHSLIILFWCSFFTHSVIGHPVFFHSSFLSFIHSFIHSFTHSLTCSLACLSMQYSTYSFFFVSTRRCHGNRGVEEGSAETWKVHQGFGRKI